MAAAESLPDLLARLVREGRGHVSQAEGLAASPPAVSLDWPELESVLPDGGLPRGVVELTSSRALGGPAAIAVAAVRASQARDGRAWAAWIDPEATLHAPGLVVGGVDLARLLVVRPPRASLGRVAVKVAAARAFDVIVVDMAHVPGARAVDAAEAAKRADASSRTARTAESTQSRGGRKRASAWPDEVLVRKLALLAEEGGASILLLTDRDAPRAVPWPVALRLELSRAPNALSVRVAKERRGRVGLAKAVPIDTRPLDRVAPRRVG